MPLQEEVLQSVERAGDPLVARQLPVGVQRPEQQPCVVGAGGDVYRLLVEGRGEAAELRVLPKCESPAGAGRPDALGPVRFVDRARVRMGLAACRLQFHMLNGGCELYGPVAACSSQRSWRCRSPPPAAAHRRMVHHSGLRPPGVGEVRRSTGGPPAVARVHVGAALPQRVAGCGPRPCRKKCRAAPSATSGHLQSPVHANRCTRWPMNSHSMFVHSFPCADVPVGAEKSQSSVPYARRLTQRSSGRLRRAV